MHPANFQQNEETSSCDNFQNGIDDDLQCSVVLVKSLHFQFIVVVSLDYENNLGLFVIISNTKTPTPTLEGILVLAIMQ